jgi:hypothetical protein
MAPDQITSPPRFESEREEADWWDSHPDFILQKFERAKTEGKLGHGTVRRRMEAMEAAKAGRALALDADDVVRANKLSERNGIERSEYLRELLHAALLKEEESMNSSSAA